MILKRMLPKDQLKKKKKFIKYEKMNEKRNTAFQNLWNTAKAVKKRIQGYVKKQKSQAILTLQLKDLEKE